MPKRFQPDYDESGRVPTWVVTRWDTLMRISTIISTPPFPRHPDNVVSLVLGELCANIVTGPARRDRWGRQSRRKNIVPFSAFNVAAPADSANVINCPAF